MAREHILGAVLIASLGLLTACNQKTAEAPAPAPVAEAPPPAPAPAPATEAAAPPAPGTNTEAVSAVQDATAGAIGAISAELTSTMKGFVGAAAISDMYEVEAGKIAQMRSKSADIKMFAKIMIDAHTQSSKKLKGVLKANTLQVEVPTALDSRRQGMIDNLTGAKDEDFDTRYLNQQQNAHQEALILFRGYAKDGDNPQLKQFASDLVPAIQMHLDKAKSLDKSGADTKASKAAAPGDVIPDNE